jgi:hypothetical protein
MWRWLLIPLVWVGCATPETDQATDTGTVATPPFDPFPAVVLSSWAYPAEDGLVLTTAVYEAPTLAPTFEVKGAALDDCWVYAEDSEQPIPVAINAGSLTYTTGGTSVLADFRGDWEDTGLVPGGEYTADFDVWDDRVSMELEGSATVPAASHWRGLAPHNVVVSSPTMDATVPLDDDLLVTWEPMRADYVRLTLTTFGAPASRVVCFAQDDGAYLFPQAALVSGRGQLLVAPEWQKTEKLEIGPAVFGATAKRLIDLTVQSSG